MKNYIAFFGLRPGDEVIVPKSGLNIIQHHVLYLGYDHYGTDWIIHNDVYSGVAVMKANDFFTQCPQITKIIRFTGTNLERLQLIKRSLRKIGKPYDMIDYNCEHFISDVKTGQPKSRQIEALILLTLTVIFISLGALLLKRKSSP